MDEIFSAENWPTKITNRISQLPRCAADKPVPKQLYMAADAICAFDVDLGTTSSKVRKAEGLERPWNIILAYLQGCQV